MAAGTKEDPWLLKTPPGTSEYSMYEDPQANPPALVCQLAEQMPEGLRYVAIRLDDGISFMHVAVLEDDDNPLAALPAFGQFVSAISERCTDGPAPVNGTVVGAYGIKG
jgi:hypothetical protein